ncbi:AT-hook motif nuclear-localized protein 6-like [Tripterygium wilfordii]|uniref:AT-hook motif nuclear-localized protein n=1 Tax=Tripterygium wilfordii TaxID=458696 RepID=A0A7J7DBZ5_TRIWF|nr:AT-hook motif nuclear-localized protein 6-like [Tripterygium wilfordii]KAF5743586.1 AT-hook motif nuclear-localized protein 6-like [Tripterygium wilfordii]
MEAKEGMNFEVALRGEEAPDSYRIVSRATENPSQLPCPTVAFLVGVAATLAPGTEVVKKKRGRPRKNSADGTVTMALSPMPISSSIPLTGDLSSFPRGRGCHIDSIKKSHKFEYKTSGDKIASFFGANFTPFVITVNAGEDVTMKVMSFLWQGARAICILSANGTISNVTLCQPTSFGGTLTYEGCFEILSLSGSYTPIENGGTKSRSGGMSVSLAWPDGRVVGGGLAGLLVAAGPVQVVVASFLPGHQQEQKHKKQRSEPAVAATPITTNALSVIAAEESKGAYDGNYGVVKPSVAPSSSFHGYSPASLNQLQIFSNSAADNKTSSPGDDSEGPGQSNSEVSS